MDKRIGQEFTNEEVFNLIMRSRLLVYIRI